MGAPIRESDDSELSKGELPENDPSRSGPLKGALQRAGTAPWDRASESIEPPRRPKTPRGVFEGDAAAVELRSRLARARSETLLPAARRSSPRHFAAALRYASFLLIAAAAAGLAGYLMGGFGGRVRPPLINSPPAGSPHATPAEAKVETPPYDSRMPAAQTAGVDLAPADAQRAAGNGATALPPHTAARPPGSSAPVPAQDPSEIATKMKIGADLMASGDIAAARTMFERVAEAGEAAGAFALAETYDPAVLRTLRLRGAIKADPALAQRWYETARDMGSAAAADRIARLTQKPR
jgi:hypothetical protein